MTRAGKTAAPAELVADADRPGQPDAAQEPIVVGRITAAHGVRGWVKIASFTEPVENLLDYRPWWIRCGDGWQELPVVDIRPQGKGYIARIEGCADRDQAGSFRGVDLWVPAARLPDTDADEFYWFELEGLEVVTEQGVALGRVDHLFATGANDVLVVKDGGRERLLPFIADVVIEVDLERARMRVDWDPEL